MFDPNCDIAKDVKDLFTFSFFFRDIQDKQMGQIAILEFYSHNLLEQIYLENAELNYFFFLQKLGFDDRE